MRDHPQFKAYVALAAVCFFWGTTYLGIRIALESLTPLMLVSSRFLISGLLILLAALIGGARLPRGRELLLTVLTGILVLGLGNGALAYAEQWIPSGLAALFITVGPFWMVGVDALIPGGDKLHASTIAGMLTGLAGSLVLLSRDGLAGVQGGAVAAFLVLQVGCVGWSTGSILQRRRGSTIHPIVSGGVQQLATGLVFLIPALLGPVQTGPLTIPSVAAVAYLITFGSIIGYSAYIYAMSELPVSVVSIYNYVNPVVAVSLGWLFYREPFGWRETAAMAIIFAGVFIVKRSTAERSH